MMQLRLNGKRRHILWLRRSHYSIGRSAACSLRLADETVDDIHAHLLVEGDVLSVSRHGNAEVRINGVLLEAESRLYHGDRITLGNTDLDVVDPHRCESIAVGDEPPLGWTLQGLNKSLNTRRYNIEGRVVIGRADDCDIRLGEAHLSRRHAQLTALGDQLEIVDLDSANGTFVNGRRITKAQLRSGDELSLDTLKFRVIHTPTSEDTGETALRTQTGAQPEPDRPMAQTAIDIQRASLQHRAECRSSQYDYRVTDPVESQLLHTGRLSMMMVVVALAGVLWGALSLFDVPLQGQSTLGAFWLGAEKGR
jgi:pSer/pThr/pTyr-binding forkhead associated (FHA) protein